MSNSDWCSTDALSDSVCGCMCTPVFDLQITLHPNNPHYHHHHLPIYLCLHLGIFWPILDLHGGLDQCCKGHLGGSWVVELGVAGWGLLACSAQTANWLLYTLRRGWNKRRKGWSERWEETTECSKVKSEEKKEEALWFMLEQRCDGTRESERWRESEGEAAREEKRREQMASGEKWTTRWWQKSRNLHHCIQLLSCVAESSRPLWMLHSFFQYYHLHSSSHHFKNFKNQSSRYLFSNYLEMLPPLKIPCCPSVFHPSPSSSSSSSSSPPICLYPTFFAPQGSDL